MAEDQPADAGGEPTFVHTPGGSGPLSPRDAARSLTDARAKANAAPPPDKQPERAPPATAAEESAPAADATSPEPEPNRETDETDLEPKAPLIDPPPSWTSEQRQHWQNLDPATQEYLVEYDKKLSSEVSRAQKEAAEQLKGLTAREQAMEQARLQFEAVTAAKVASLQKQLQGEFADIQTAADIRKMADEDWARHHRWIALQTEIALETQQHQAAQQRQAEEAQAKFAKFADEQDKAFVERVPEFANKDRATELQSAAIKTLKNIGFSDDELGKHWNKQETLSLRDARMQELIHKAARWDEAQEAKKTVTAKKDLPPVQRPGVARQGDSKLAQIQTIQKQLNNATGVAALRLATQLTKLQRESGPH